MSNPKYIKGRLAEYKVIKILEKKGYICVRSAGSHGIDIVAFLTKNNTEEPFIRIISVKAIKYVGKKALKEIKDLPISPMISKELWHFKPYKKEPIIL